MVVVEAIIKRIQMRDTPVTAGDHCFAFPTQVSSSPTHEKWYESVGQQSVASDFGRRRQGGEISFLFTILWIVFLSYLVLVAEMGCNFSSNWSGDPVVVVVDVVCIRFSSVFHVLVAANATKVTLRHVSFTLSITRFSMGYAIRNTAIGPSFRPFFLLLLFLSLTNFLPSLTVLAKVTTTHSRLTE